MKNSVKLFNLIIFCGIFIILGTAGLSDIEALTFNQCLVRILIAFTLIGFGSIGKIILSYVKICRLCKIRKEKHKKQLQFQI